MSTSSQNASFLGCVSRDFVVSNTLALLGDATRPVLGCLEPPVHNGSQSLLSFKGDGNVNSRLILKNLSVKNIELSVTDLHIEIIDCNFNDATLKLLTSEEESDRNTDVRITHSLWQSTIHCSEIGYCVPSSGLYVDSHGSLRFHVSYTEFLQQYVVIYLKSDADILFKHIHTSHDLYEAPLLGGLYIKLESPSAQRVRVTFHDSLFNNQHHWHPVSSVVNFYDGALILHVRNMTEIPDDNITISIRNCTFFNNERAVVLRGSIQRAEITECTFDTNIAMHHGAAVNINITGNNRAILRNCTFANNAAGQVRVHNVEPHFEHLSFTDNATKTEAKVDSEFAKGHIRLIGRGGAIRLESGNITLENCSFFNNTASIEGGAIFVDRQASVDIIDCYFMNTPDVDKLAEQGDVLFSVGSVSLHGIHITVQASSVHNSIVQHRGGKWSLSLNYITIHCPKGTWVIETSDFSYQKVSDGVVGSYKYDEFSLGCEACQKSMYSIEQGFLHYSSNFTSDTYFALHYPGRTAEGDTGLEFSYMSEKKDIDCKPCPYGGKCETRLQSTPNFWGYVDGVDVKFHVCPDGYCCEQQPCKSYDSCAEHRTGTLCANCVDGYTEALYSTKCVANEQCGHSWIWLFAAGSGIMFVVLLIFQQDIRNFIFTIPTLSKCRENFSLRTRRRQASEEDGMEDETASMKATEEAKQTEGHDNNLAMEMKNKEGSDKEGSDDEEMNLHTDIGEVLLIIIMYYFQDAMLFRVKTAFSALDDDTHDKLQTVLLSLFDFQLDATPFVENACLMPNLSPVQKLFVLTLNVPFVLLLFGIIYLLYIGLSHYLKTSDWSGFLSRLSSAFMLGLLFTYQQLATAAFTVLSCVPIGDHNVLFTEGTVLCYQWWQYVVMLYVISCVVPFFAILLFGPSLLLKGKIGLKTFFLACLLPLPFLLYWLALRLTKYKRKVGTLKHVHHELTPQCEAILNDVQGPFRDLKLPVLGRLCWAGMEVFRRLLLVLMFTFINNSLIRLMAMLIVSFLMLFHYVCVRPYSSTLLNLLGSVSFSALLIIGGINFTYAAFEAAEYIPKGPDMKLVNVLQEVENVLLLWFPLAIMIIILLALIFKIVYCIATCIVSRIKG